MVDQGSNVIHCAVQVFDCGKPGALVQGPGGHLRRLGNTGNQITP